MLALLQQMQASEQLEPEVLARRQMSQLHSQLLHAVRNIPHYKNTISSVPQSLDEFIPFWNSIPILSRAEVQNAGDKICSTAPPKGHQLIGTKTTSGSTGMPVKVFSSNISRVYWMVNTVRAYLWQGCDFTKKLASIRPELEAGPGKTVRLDRWGKSSAMLTKTGPAIALSIRTPLDQQVNWLETERPNYLLTLPTNLRALREAGADLAFLDGVHAYGELLDTPTREFVEQGMPWRIYDGYSSQEVGNITLQCEQFKHHVLSDCVYLEVIDEEGAPCPPGETGRVIVTTLQNAVAPLIRYAIGDYAKMGESCACGRSLPVVQQILGRKRNMVRLPDGSSHWPSFPQKDWSDGIPIRQFQLVQSKPDTIDVRIVARGTINPQQEAQMRQGLQQRLNYPFTINFVYTDHIPRSAGGKYEDFMSLLT